MKYTCKLCGGDYDSPFDDTEQPDTCPTCWKLIPFEERRRLLYSGEGEPRRLRRAKKRAERIAADIEAHQAALDACVEGLAKEVFRDELV